jgi:hypothetical protein
MLLQRELKNNGNPTASAANMATTPRTGEI